MKSDTAGKIYRGRVMHMRLAPVQHRFRYRVFSLFLDIDQMEETIGRLKLMGLNRFGLMSFHDKDHGARDGSPLRPWVDNEHRKRGLPVPHRVWVLAFPRMLGFVFNPLTLYYGYDKVGALTSVVYEVKNTFGDQTCYVLPCASTGEAVSQDQKKMMYVSPFIELDQTYHFRLNPPGERLGLRIKQDGTDGQTLISSINADAAPLNDWTLLRNFVAHPLMTLKVVAGIHFEALRLALKGVYFRRYSQTRVFADEKSSP